MRRKRTERTSITNKDEQEGQIQPVNSSTSMVTEMRKVTKNYKVTGSKIASAPVKKEVSQQSETMTMQILKDGKPVSPMDSDATPATNATTNVKYQQEQMSAHKLPPVRDFFVEGDEDKQFRIIETFVETRQGQNMI